VAWFHFTQGAVLPEGMLKASGVYGWAGAEVFFVISGFVMPLALARSGYKLRDFSVFLARRMARLQPPLIASMLLVWGLLLVSRLVPGFRGTSVIDVGILLANVTLAADWLGIPWIVPVYWTLAIELQYYILLGLAFGLLNHEQLVVRTTVLLALIACSPAFHETNRFVLGYGAFFALGFAAYLRKSARIGRGELLLYVVAGAVSCWLRGGAVLLVAGLFPTLSILVFDRRIPGLNAIGRLSYSLYLIHIPIGGRVLNLATRLDMSSLWRQLAALSLALILSLAASYVLYRLVELPAQRWAQRLGRSRPSGSAHATLRA
jgi:peptidoglycan/LPS O-acetylase OafA/YrhL